MAKMKIAIVGYGVEGRALTEYFRTRGHEVTVCDKETIRLKSPKPANVSFHFGAKYLEGLEKFDLVFRSPGIPYLKKEFDAVRARAEGKLTSLTKYFFEKCPCPIVGITGTKGKGTTATLLYEMVKRHRPGTVYLGGNIGEPPLNFLDSLKPHDLVILELSSFQLQDIDRSPHIAVVLGITPDHLDHHQDMDEYVAAKKNIVKFQGAEDFVILDFDNKFSAGFARDTKARVRHVSTEKEVKEGGMVKVGSLVLRGPGKEAAIIGEKGQTGLIGDHNLKNILAASEAAHLLGVPVEIISKIVHEFRGLPHRLEFVCEAGGVRYYNDSASTNPETAIAALRTFNDPTIIILGGSDKNVDFSPLGLEITRRLNIKTAILMGQTKKKIEEAIEKSAAETGTRRNVPLELIAAESYQEAFMVARLIAKPGDVVLLSPGCASFDMFTNYKERGEVFRNFVMS